MKVIIAGSRTIDSWEDVYSAVRESNFQIDEIVSGGAKGVDKLGEIYAQDFAIDLVVFHANWKNYPRRAGILRNKKMANYADALIAVWDGKSRGTSHMIDCMVSLQKPVYVKYV